MWRCLRGLWLDAECFERLVYINLAVNYQIRVASLTICFLLFAQRDSFEIASLDYVSVLAFRINSNQGPALHGED